MTFRLLFGTLLFALITSFAGRVCAQALAPEAALHLVTYQSWGFTVDGTPQGQRVRRILTEARDLGFKQVIFNFRGFMVTGTGSDIHSAVPLSEQANEEKYLLETVRYAKSLGLHVGFRPILLVVGPHGEFPYISGNTFWWHGVIKPAHIDTWFANYFKFHERYLRLAHAAQADWYSLGAEMHSMTSGLGERDPSWSLGFPDRWSQMADQAHAILGPQTKLTYGLNYTDQYVMENGNRVWGGEFEQWHFFMTADFKTPKYQAHQKALQELWKKFDVIGIDYYRALASSGDSFSNNFASLSQQLTPRPRSHADQMDSALTEIALTLGEERPVYFQETGFRSVTKSFLDPSSYEEDGGTFNETHQAAAWEAFFQAFWVPSWPWMSGVGVWQTLVDADPVPGDKGFSPLGKSQTESVFRNHLLPAR